MCSTWAVLSLLLTSTFVAAATFESDVIQKRNHDRKKLQHHNEDELRHELLSRAVPLAEYERKLKLASISSEHPDSGLLSRSNRQLAENDDDFTVAYDNMYSFSGYSIKFAKCQPVQYFSENAILAGEHSPMVTQDIVILRLCPFKSCSESASYGCYYNYAEYAIALSDYAGIMLRWATKKQEEICQWCDDCLNGSSGRRRRKLADNDEGDDVAGDDAAAGDDVAAAVDGDGDGDDAAAAAEDAAAEDDAADNDDVGGDDGSSSSSSSNANTDDKGSTSCTGYSTYCSDYDSVCASNDDTYLSYEGYMDYLDCSQVNYNNYAYFVRPRCDGTTNSIKMAVYYDNYCIQYAGNDVSIKDLGLGFKEGVFKDFSNSTCIDCSESENPPNFETPSTLCNLLHYSSAKCTSELMYDLFAAEEDQSIECSYIESLRFGAYDEYGQFSSSSASNSWSAEVTIGQQIWMGVAIGACICSVVYACYLHHSMTNLLIKSLSHRELLPPSRTSRRSPGPGRSRSGTSNKSKMKHVSDEPDWDNVPSKENQVV